MALTDSKVRQAKPTEKTYRLADEKGLYLEVHTNGSRYWRHKYRFNQKEKRMAYGVYPDVSLKDARDKRDNTRKLLADGVDPSLVKKAQQVSLSEAHTNNFEAIAREWFATKMQDKSDSHKDRTLRALKRDLFPHLGALPIGDITPPMLLAVLRKIESRGAVETAHRAKQTAGQIFRFAVSSGRAERDPSSDLTGALKPPKKKHLASITDPKEVGNLMLAIEGFQGTATVMAALKLSPILFSRPGELRHMEWDEINFESEQWEIPAEKMKIGQPHIVPLPKQAIAILKDHQLLTGRGKYVFPSARGASRPLSDNGVRTALRTLGYDNDTMTPHGFRATARTLLDEVLGFRIEWIEQQLAHTVRDPQGRAYNRTKHLPQRKDMMQKWADYLDNLKAQAASSNVVIGGFTKAQ